MLIFSGTLKTTYRNIQQYTIHQLEIHVIEIQIFKDDKVAASTTLKLF